MTKKKPVLQIGPLSKKNTTSHYYMPSQNFESPTRITNASSTEPLKLSDYRKTPARPGSEDFLRWPSKGA